MSELIKITEKNNKRAVSARELHELLEVKTPFSKWAVRKITSNSYFTNPDDYIRVDNFVQAGQSANEYALSIDCAKKIAMSENSHMGNNVRDYFLKCERELKEKLQPKLPENYLSALKALVESEEKKQIAESKVKELVPKADFYDTVTGSSDTIDIGSVAKVINMGLGRNRLFQKLRDFKILQGNNRPFQQYIDRGYFRVIESSYEKSDGSTHISLKTVVYQKGIDYIIKRLNK